MFPSGCQFAQQNCVGSDPAVQVRLGSVCSGVSVPSHENPNEPGVGQVMLSSCAHVPATNVMPVRQQYAKRGASVASATPMLHDRVGSA